LNHDRQPRHVLLAVSVGNMLEWYDFNVFAFMALPIAKNFFPGSNPAAALLSAQGLRGGAQLANGRAGQG